MERPKITRQGNKVVLECPDETAAEQCKAGIEKAFSNPLVSRAIMKHAKKRQ